MVCSNFEMSCSIDRMLPSPPPITLFKALPIVFRPAAMIAQQGSRNWLFTGFGATRNKITSKTPVRTLYRQATARPCFTLAKSFFIGVTSLVPLEQIQDLTVHIARNRGSALSECVLMCQSRSFLPQLGSEHFLCQCLTLDTRCHGGCRYERRGTGSGLARLVLDIICSLKRQVVCGVAFLEHFQVVHG